MHLRTSSRLYQGYVFGVEDTIYPRYDLLTGRPGLPALGGATQALAAGGWHQDVGKSSIDVVIASYDRGFEYRRLEIALDAVWLYKRAGLLTTNPDPYCRYPEAAASTDTGCEADVGKVARFTI